MFSRLVIFLTISALPFPRYLVSKVSWVSPVVGFPNPLIGGETVGVSQRVRDLTSLTQDGTAAGQLQ